MCQLKFLEILKTTVIMVSVLQLVSVSIWAPEIALFHVSSVNRSWLLNTQPNMCSFLGLHSPFAPLQDIHVDVTSIQGIIDAINSILASIVAGNIANDDNYTLKAVVANLQGASTLLNSLQGAATLHHEQMEVSSSRKRPHGCGFH